MEKILPEGHYKRLQLPLSNKIQLDSISETTQKELLSRVDGYVNSTGKKDLNEVVTMLSKIKLNKLEPTSPTVEDWKNFTL